MIVQKHPRQEWQELSRQSFEWTSHSPFLEMTVYTALQTGQLWNLKLKQAMSKKHPCFWSYGKHNLNSQVSSLRIVNKTTMDHKDLKTAVDHLRFGWLFRHDNRPLWFVDSPPPLGTCKKPSPRQPEIHRPSSSLWPSKKWRLGTFCSKGTAEKTPVISDYLIKNWC